MYGDIKKGCDNITYADIDAYQRLSNDTLQPWEVDLMIEIDIVRRNHG